MMRKDVFRQCDEVGTCRDQAVAVMNVKYLYGYIFNNLSPKSWAIVTLNKEERLSTNMWEFSIIYFKNMK